MQVTEAATLLIKKIEQDYRDDIAVVVMMGSHLYQDTHPKSDLDLYFIPKTERGYQLGFVFIMQGIGFDFWPISWERIERIAKREERITAIITEGKVLYHGTAADLERFNHYRLMALDKRDQKRLQHLAYKQLQSAQAVWFDCANASTTTEARRHAISALFHVVESLALFNGTTIKRGRGKLKTEILAMPFVPDGFERLYDAIFVSDQTGIIKQSMHDLIRSTRSLYERHHDRLPKEDFKSLATGFYEELINHYHKIERAVTINDAHTALYVAREIENELAWLFADSGTTPPELPDLIEAYDADHLDVIGQAAKQHQEMLVAYFTSRGVTFRMFENEEELEAYLVSL
ncbi:MAG: hypothetical protein EA375_02285 [Acholeplasmataceae bacterium]|nr:MAG: hypothetical protein EA375_02285 [Acholeplasmataceae bacterium]